MEGWLHNGEALVRRGERLNVRFARPSSHPGPPSNTANLLKPALARGDLHCIGATTGAAGPPAGRLSWHLCNVCSACR